MITLRVEKKSGGAVSGGFVSVKPEVMSRFLLTLPNAES